MEWGKSYINATAIKQKSRFTFVKRLVAQALHLSNTFQKDLVLLAAIGDDPLA